MAQCTSDAWNRSSAVIREPSRRGADGGLLPTGLNTLNFNDGAGGADYFGKTKEIGYYDEVLTDLELETLTSYRNWESMVKELNLNVIYNG